MNVVKGAKEKRRDQQIGQAAKGMLGFADEDG